MYKHMHKRATSSKHVCLLPVGIKLALSCTAYIMLNALCLNGLLFGKTNNLVSRILKSTMKSSKLMPKLDWVWLCHCTALLHICDQLCENPQCTHLVVIRETPV